MGHKATTSSEGENDQAPTAHVIGGYTVPKLSIENRRHVQQQPLNHPTTSSSGSLHPSNFRAPASLSFNIDPTGE